MQGRVRTQARALQKRAGVYNVQLGGRISLLRRARGMSQAELAKKLGVTPQQVQKYERGTNRVSAVRLYEIATALDVRIQYFFDDMGEGTAIAGGASAGKVSAEDFLWVLAKLKDESMRWRVLRLIAALIPEQD
jgi:transcriptional regulator with XRE-family HTH domain